MAALVFPTNPTDGQIFTSGTSSWRWNASIPAWEDAPTPNLMVATNVTNTPAGNISAVTVQAAINELDSEKLPLSGGTMTGQLNASASQSIASSGEALMTRALSDGRYASKLSIRTSGFTAVAYARYGASGTFTVSDPATGALNDVYEVRVLSGSVTVGGVAYPPSRIPVIRRCSNSTGPVWETLPAPELDEMAATGITEGYVLTAQGDGTAAFEAAAAGGVDMQRVWMQTGL